MRFPRREVANFPKNYNSDMGLDFLRTNKSQVYTRAVLKMLKWGSLQYIFLRKFGKKTRGSGSTDRINANFCQLQTNIKF